MTTLARLEAAALAHRVSPSQRNLSALIAAGDTHADWLRRNADLLRQSERLASYHSPGLGRQIREHLNEHP